MQSFNTENIAEHLKLREIFPSSLSCSLIFCHLKNLLKIPSKWNINIFNAAILQRNFSNFSKLLRSILLLVMLALCWSMTNQHLCPVLTQTPVWQILFKEWAWRFLTEDSDAFCLRNSFLQRPRAFYGVLISWVKFALRNLGGIGMNLDWKLIWSL